MSLFEIMSQNVTWTEVGDGAEGADGDNDLNQIVRTYLNDIESDGEYALDEYDEDQYSTSEAEAQEPNVGPLIPLPRTQFQPLEEPTPPIQSLPQVTPSKATRILGLVRGLLAPFSKLWDRQTQQDQKKQVADLTYQYCRFLLCFVGEQNLPADAVAAFEKILEHEVRACTGGPFGFINPRAEEGYGIIELPKDPAHGVSALRNLLEVSLRSIRCISTVTEVLHEAMNADAGIHGGTAGHTLYNQYRKNVFGLLTRLDILSGLAKRLFADLLKNESIIGLLKLSDISELSYLNTSVCGDVPPSVVSQIEALSVMLIESVVRFMGFMSSMWCQEVVGAREAKLIGVTDDLAISLDDFNDNVISHHLDFVHVVETTASLLKCPAESPRRSGSQKFTREHKIVKHYTDISKLSELLSARISVATGIATRLNACTKDEIPANGALVAELESQHSGAERLMKSMGDLMQIQSLLIGQLMQPQHPVPASDTLYVTLQDTKYDTPAGTRIIDETDVQPSEFQTIIADECADEDVVIGEVAVDEVFMGTVDTDCSAQRDVTNFDVEEKLTNQLYSGVVDQLKTVLVPVQTVMNAREKAAILKSYGEVQDDEEPESHGSLTDGQDNATTSQRSTLETASTSYGNPVSTSSHHEDQERGAMSELLGAHFIGELRSVMNIGRQLVNEESTERFGDDSDAEASDKED